MKRIIISFAIYQFLFFTPLGFTTGAFSKEISYNNEAMDDADEAQDEIRVIPLVTIISQPENNLIHKLNLHCDSQGRVVKITRTSEENVQVIDPQYLLSHDVVLASTGNRDSVLLGCDSWNPKTGGSFYLKYLFNGALMRYKTYHMKVKKVRGSWKLFSSSGNRELNTIRLVSRIILGQLIGVHRIERVN